METTGEKQIRFSTLARNGIGAKECFIGIISLILITDIFILLDIAFLRQFLGFITFSFIPGALTLYILRIKGIKAVKSLVLSFSLSMAFIMLTGLVINFVLPLIGIEHPLSTVPLLVSFSIIMALMAIIAYQRNRNDFSRIRLPALYNEEENGFTFLILLPIIFPLLSVLGTRIMYSGGDNIISVLFYLSIPAYVIFIIWQRKRVPKIAFPLSISMISLSILLARSMTSGYLVGGDIYSEYETSLYVFNSLHWSLHNVPESLASLNSCLSVGLLLPVFQSILGITTLIIYKVIGIVLIAIVPLIGYLVYEKHVGQLYAFLAAVFVTAQIPFIYLLTGHLRVGIAMIFFMATVMVLFDKEIGKLHRSILLLIFEVCMIASYYVLPAVVFALFLMLWLIPTLANTTGRKWPVIIGGWNVVLIVVLIFVWWGQATDAAFNGYVFYIQNTVKHLSQMFVPEMRGAEITTMLGGATALPQQITTLLNDACFAAIAMGIVFCFRSKRLRNRFDRSYATFMLVSMVPLIAAIVMPYASLGYGGDRLFVQVVPVLAPAFIIGCVTVAGFIQNKLLPALKPKLDLALVGILLAGLFICNTFMLHYFMGGQGTEVFDRNTARYTALYVHDDEVVAANWLDKHNTIQQTAYINRLTQMGTSIFLFTEAARVRDYEILPLRAEDFVSNREILLFFRRPELRGINAYTRKEVFITEYWVKDYLRTIDFRNKIYTTGNTEIYK